MCSDELTAYLDGELSAATAEQLRRHLDMCPPCRDELQALQGAASFVESHAPDVEPDPEIWNNLRARIAAMPTPADRSGFFQFLVVNRWAAMVATLVSVVVLGIGLWSYQAHQASRRALESYMQEYILMRSVTERLYAVEMRQLRLMRSEWGVIPTPPLDNPFVDQRPVSLANPFVSEGR